jgi:primosomal replication protein N
VVASSPERRRTPAGTPVVSFRLRVEPDPENAADPGCLVPVVWLGEAAARADFGEGAEVEVTGGLTERRWKGAGGVRQSRFEILAGMVRVL